MKDVLELQQLNEGSEVEPAKWYTIFTTLIGTSTISNNCR
ncbi:class III lanthipeptide [Bacillus andreraoultii]|nr:class III lanthipeptide [Bacillus andreraoultii]